MRILALILVYFFAAISLAYGQVQRIDVLYEITLLDEQLLDFLKTYTSKHKQNVYSLHVNKFDEHYRSYELSSPGYWIKENTPPLAFAKYQGNIILIFSGIEEFFPSKERQQSLLGLIEGKLDILTENDIPPNVDIPSGKLVVCDSSRVIERVIKFNAVSDPCLIELPPLDDEN